MLRGSDSGLVSVANSVARSKAQAANAEALRIDTKLGEISIPNVVRGLSPRRFMDEWERSLIAPGSGDKENNPPET